MPRCACGLAHALQRRRGSPVSVTGPDTALGCSAGGTEARWLPDAASSSATGLQLVSAGWLQAAGALQLGPAPVLTLWPLAAAPAGFRRRHGTCCWARPSCCWPRQPPPPFAGAHTRQLPASSSTSSTSKHAAAACRRRCSLSRRRVQLRSRHKRERALLCGCACGSDAPAVALPLMEALAGPAGLLAACSAAAANALAGAACSRRGASRHALAARCNLQLSCALPLLCLSVCPSSHSLTPDCAGLLQCLAPPTCWPAPPAPPFPSRTHTTTAAPTAASGGGWPKRAWAPTRETRRGGQAAGTCMSSGAGVRRCDAACMQAASL